MKTKTGKGPFQELKEVQHGWRREGIREEAQKAREQADADALQQDDLLTGSPLSARNANIAHLPESSERSVNSSLYTDDFKIPTSSPELSVGARPFI